MKSLLLILSFVLVVISCTEPKTQKEPVTTESALTEAPDFRAVSLAGETVSLQSFPRKYIVLDFWGTWCPYCVKGIPEMKKYYERYNDRMEIVGVDTGDNETDLRDFIKEHEMAWTHIISDEDDVDGSLCALYGVDGFPTKIIIDPDGFVVGRYTGESPDFYQKLDEIMKSKD